MTIVTGETCTVIRVPLIGGGYRYAVAPRLHMEARIYAKDEEHARDMLDAIEANASEEQT